MPKQTVSPLLLETIKIEDGKIHNLAYHQKRCEYSRQTLFGSHDTLELASFINVPAKGLYRCRILYEKTFHSVSYIPYTPKEINALKIVTSNIKYDFKYANREAFNTLLQANQDVDEVIIEKEGFLTDTTIANIAFYDGEQWVTPKKPLLQGTMRAKLIDEGLLKTADISKEDLPKYTHVALMNAMIGFKILNISTIK